MQYNFVDDGNACAVDELEDTHAPFSLDPLLGDRVKTVEIRGADGASQPPAGRAMRNAPPANALEHFQQRFFLQADAQTLRESHKARAGVRNAGFGIILE